MYGSHHKVDSPLIKLPIDMIVDFPIGDALHLLDLGIMKKCLVGWRDGKFGNYKTKWSTREINDLTQMLAECKLPRELHRKVRGLDTLGHWKGLEFRSFLYYLSIVVLKPVLAPDVYAHFLIFFCAITICSCEEYSKFLDLAQTMLNYFITKFGDIYGIDYITSNVHNLKHLVADVKKFGILSQFSAYPFESKLYQIKNMVRSGNKPLSQVAKRMGELNQIENRTINTSKNKPILKKLIPDTNVYERIDFEYFSLSKDKANSWFLTKDSVIVKFENVSCNENIITMQGTALKETEDFFCKPIKSKHINIHYSDCEQDLIKTFHVTDIKCKLVAVKEKGTGKHIFIPLLHSINCL